MRVESDPQVSALATEFRSDWGEWALAFVASALVNMVAVPMAIGLLSTVKVRDPEPSEVAAAEAVAVIHREMLQPVADEEPAEESRPRPFAHTSDEQESGKPERGRYIGERDTVAAADKAPADDDVLLPTQDGREIRGDGDLETVSRDYQDGTLDHGDDGIPGETGRPMPAVEASESVAAEPEIVETPEYVREAPKRERLAEGPNPVDRPLPPEAMKESETVREAAEQAKPEEVATAEPKPAVAGGGKPGFRGNQMKTRLKGSISRRGQSSLDVENNAVGRYQAALNRAVEREWQRNCVRYRDFITPGFLTLRFLVEADGEVRAVEFLEVVEAGEIQKGFTLNSIRSAPIPVMPAELKRELDGEALELIYNFYF